jgi:hypothetical protein
MWLEVKEPAGQRQIQKIKKLYNTFPLLSSSGNKAQVTSRRKSPNIRLCLPATLSTPQFCCCQLLQYKIPPTHFVSFFIAVGYSS